ncbi:MAG: hypothetical protein PVI83_08770, partial [Lysobacterales bacterium]
MKLTRREWIRISAGAGLAAFAGFNPAAAGPVSRIDVTIPSSGIRVPAVGIGTVKFRGAPGSADMEPLRSTLEAFHRAGGRVV